MCVEKRQEKWKRGAHLGGGKLLKGTAARGRPMLKQVDP